MALGEEWSRIMSNMQREVDRLVTDITARKPPSCIYSPSAWQPAVDCYETDSDVVVLAEVAGLKPEDIEISISGRILKLRGDRKDPRQGLRRSYCLMEVGWGPFEREVVLPAEVDYSRATANYESGLLEVSLPKVSGQSRQVKIKG